MSGNRTPAIYPILPEVQIELAPIMNDIEALKSSCTIFDIARHCQPDWQPKASCCSPFRKEEKPSFSVYAGGRRWKDFGTDESGDVIDFVARSLQVPLKEATRFFISLATGQSSMVNTAPMRPARSDRERKALEEEERAQKRLAWAFRDGTPEEMEESAGSRSLSPEAIELGVMLGTVKFTTCCGYRSWVLTDNARVCAEARRVGGEPFPAFGKHGPRKAHSLPGSCKSWLVGSAILPRLPQIQKLVLCEGGPDYLAALEFIALKVDGLKNTPAGRMDTLPVALLGRSAGNVIHPGSLSMVKGMQVRIFAHADRDGGGMVSANAWARQLHQAGCKIDLYDFSGLLRVDGTPVKDLNDLCHMRTQDRLELGEVIP